MTDITNPLDHMPRRDVSVNAGAVSIEQERAIAEARGQIQLAKMFPRSIAEHHRDNRRSESRKAAYKDSWIDNFNPGQFSDVRQQQWSSEKYNFILSKRSEWR